MPTKARRRDAWLRHPVGTRVLEAEQARLAEVLPNLFGYYLLQAGGWGRHIALCDDSRIRRRFLADTNTKRDPDLVAQPDALPILSDSIDVVVLPHTLELAGEPHRVLRETERVLIGDGHVVILGFNPWSAWGLWRLFLRRRGVPWSGRFIAERTLRDWLALLGFDIVAVYHHSHALPARLGAIDRWLERAAERGWPLPAGAYVLVARKRTVPITPLRPRWRPAKPFATPVGVAQNSAIAVAMV